MEMVQPIRFSAHIQPSCVGSDEGHRSLEQEYGTVSGWGWTHENQAENDRSDVLRKATVKIWNNEVCERSYRSLGKSNTIGETQLCAGYENGQIDSCWVSIQLADTAQMLCSGFTYLHRRTPVAH